MEKEKKVKPSGHIGYSHVAVRQHGFEDAAPFISKGTTQNPAHH